MLPKLLNLTVIDEMASNRDLSKFPFQKRSEVLAKQDGNRGWR